MRALGGNASSRALAGARRRAAERPVRRLGQLAGLRSGRPGGSPRGARRRQRRQWPRRARRHDRDDQPVAISGTSGELDAGSRDSLEARGRVGVRAGGGVLSVSGRGERGDGFIPISEATRAARPTSRRLIASGAGAGAGSRRSAARPKLQASVDGFHDWRTRGTDFSANRTDGADASRAAGRARQRGNGARLAIGSGATSMSSFASVSPGRTDGGAGVAAGRRAVARARRKRGGPPAACRAGSSCGSAPTRAARRRVARALLLCRGEPTRRRFAGGQTWTSGAFAEASVELARVTLTGGARLDYWRISDGHLFETDDRDRRGPARRA